MDLLMQIIGYWRSTLACAVASCAIGVGLAYLIPAEWEAVAMLRPGFVFGAPVESVAELVERTRGPELLSEVGRGLGYADLSSLKRLRKKIRVAAIGDSVQIMTRGEQAEQAKNLAVLVTQHIVAKQSELIREKKLSMSEVVAVYQKLVDAQALELVSAGSAGKWRTDILYLQMDQTRRTLVDLQTQVLPPRTVMPIVMQHPATWPSPVWPSKPLFGALFFILGLMLGMARALAKFKA